MVFTSTIRVAYLVLAPQESISPKLGFRVWKLFFVSKEFLKCGLVSNLLEKKDGDVKLEEFLFIMKYFVGQLAIRKFTHADIKYEPSYFTRCRNNQASGDIGLTSVYSLVKVTRLDRTKVIKNLIQLLESGWVEVFQLRESAPMKKYRINLSNHKTTRFASFLRESGYFENRLGEIPKYKLKRG